MWTTLALMSALAVTPAQGKGELQLKNPRFTYGILGQERKDSTFLPGDMVVLSFDIEGLNVKDDGSARYSMGMKLVNHKKNKVVFERDPTELSVTNTLGGARQPAFAITNLFPDSETGKYTMKVDVKDIQGNTKAQLEREFTVKPLEFGIVRPGFVYLNLAEEQGPSSPILAPPLAVPGQNLMLHFTAVGFTEAGNNNLPKVSVQVEIQDESGKPVIKPISRKKPVETYDDPQLQKLKMLPLRVPIQVNRSGNYKIVLSATDEHTHKTTTFPPLDLKVVEVNK